MVANVDGAATFLTSMPADGFGSGWTSDVVKTSGAGTSTGSDFGSSSGKGCACSAVTQRKSVTIIANVNMY